MKRIFKDGHSKHERGRNQNCYISVNPTTLFYGGFPSISLVASSNWVPFSSSPDLQLVPSPTDAISSHNRADQRRLSSHRWLVRRSYSPGTSHFIVMIHYLFQPQDVSNECSKPLLVIILDLTRLMCLLTPQEPLKCSELLCSLKAAPLFFSWLLKPSIVFSTVINQNK